MAYALLTSVAAVGGPNGGTSGAIDTTGATLLVQVGSYQGTITFSDSKGNTWVPLTEQNGTGGKSRIAYVLNPRVGTGHTFTTAGTSVFSGVLAAAFSGADPTSPFDQENGATSGATNSLATGSITPSQDNELIIAGVWDAGDGGVFSINGGFTIAQQNPAAGSNNYGGALAYLIQTTAAAANPTWSDTNAQMRAATIASFKFSSNAPPTKILFRAAGAQAASNASPQSPALPTGHAAGDTLLLFCSQASAAAVTFTPPAGWTSIGRNSDATRAMTIEVFAKIDNGAESAPSVATSAATAGWTAQIGAWYNVDDGVIVDATAVSSNAAAAATFQPTGITTLTNYAWVISYVCSKDDNALNYNTQNGYTDRMSGANYDTTVGNGSDQAIGVADKEFSSAGAQTCPTWNESVLGNDAWVGLTLALRPKTLVWGARPDGLGGQGLMTQLLAT